MHPWDLVFVPLHTELLSLWFMIQKLLKVFPNSCRHPEKERGLRDWRINKIAIFKVLKECSVPMRVHQGLTERQYPE